MSGDEMDDDFAGPVPEGLELDVKSQAAHSMPSHLSRAALGEALSAALDGPSAEELAEAEERADFGAEPTWFLGAVPYAVRVALRLVALSRERKDLGRARARLESSYRSALADLGRQAIRVLPTEALRGPLGEQLARVQMLRREAGTAARRAETARSVGHQRASVLDDRIRDLRNEQEPIRREADERASAAAALEDLAARATSRRATIERNVGALLEAVSSLEAVAQSGLEPAELAPKREELESARQELERARVVEKDTIARARQADAASTAKARDASQLRIRVEQIERERETVAQGADAIVRKGDPAIAALDDAYAELGDRVVRTGTELPDAGRLLDDIRRRSAALDEVTHDYQVTTLARRAMHRRSFVIGASILGALVALVLFVVVFEIVR